MPAAIAQWCQGVAGVSVRRHDSATYATDPRDAVVVLLARPNFALKATATGKACGTGTKLRRVH